MKNVLVLENIGELEAQIGDYLSNIQEKHPEVNVEVLYGLMSAKQDDILAALAKCDTVMLQSTFSNGTQFKNFLKLLSSFKNIKEIHVVYHYSTSQNRNEFLSFLSFKTLKEERELIVNMLKTKKIYDVLFFEADISDGKKDTYFKKIKRYFSANEIYYVKKEDVFWHRTKPHFVLPGDELYIDDHSKATLTIHPKDKDAFKSLMQELRSMVEAQKESCQARDFGDSKTLIKEKDEWLDLMDRYKL